MVCVLCSYDYRSSRYRRISGRRLSDDYSLQTFTSHSVHQTLIRCDFSPFHSTGSQFVYTGSSDGGIYIYDILTGQPERILGGHSSIVREASWHPYENIIISASWDSCSKVFTHQNPNTDRATDEHEPF